MTIVEPNGYDESGIIGNDLRFVRVGLGIHEELRPFIYNLLHFGSVVTTKQTPLQLVSEAIKSSSFYENISQEYILTTADKIRLCLHDHQDILEAKNDWIIPTGILIPLLVALVATDFKEFLGLNPEVWMSSFIFGSILSGGWLLWALYRVIKLRGRGSIEYIVQKLKQDYSVSGQEE